MPHPTAAAEIASACLNNDRVPSYYMATKRGSAIAFATMVVLTGVVAVSLVRGAGAQSLYSCDAAFRSLIVTIASRQSGPSSNFEGVAAANADDLRRFATSHRACPQAESAETLLNLPNADRTCSFPAYFAHHLEIVGRAVRGRCAGRSLSSLARDGFNDGARRGASLRDEAAMRMLRDLRLTHEDVTPTLRAEVDLDFASYLVRVGAYGRSAAALQRAEESARAAGARQNDFSSNLEYLRYLAYRAMGEKELALEHLRRARRIFETHPGEHRVGYEIRHAVFQEAAEDRDYEAMDRVAVWLDTDFGALQFGVEQSVQARHHELARYLLNWMERRYGDDGRYQGRINCLRAAVEVDRAETIRQYQYCHTQLQDALVEFGMYERMGQFEVSEELFARNAGYEEERRSTLPVPERIAYFNSRAREWYWGATRMAARLAMAEPSDRTKFANAVAQSDRIRSRHLTDASGNTYVPLTGTDVLSLAAALPPSDAVVGLTIMTDNVVVWGFSRENQSIEVLDVTRAEVDEQVTRIVAALSNRNSDISAISTDLLQLSASILRPVLPLLVGKSRVIFVMDGALHRIPTSLLSADASEYRPFLDQAETLATPTLRQVSSDGGATSGGAFVAFGDPDYARLSLAAGRNAPRANQMGNALQRSGDTINVAPLPETRIEIEQISALVTTGQHRIFLGEYASETAFKNLHNTQARYVHLATHGLIAGEIPGLSEPSLLLTPDGVNDGRLTLSEVEALRISTEITVLSACNTGSGRLSDGEGVLGLSRAFLVAGSRNVVMSLWPVDSEVTVDLMYAFYRELSAGQEASSALRAAALEVRVSYPHPYYWAPFSLIAQSPLSSRSN